MFFFFEKNNFLITSIIDNNFCQEIVLEVLNYKIIWLVDILNFQNLVILTLLHFSQKNDV